MNKQASTIFLGAVIAMGLGVYGFSNSFAAPDASTLQSETLMMGHLTLTATNENGDIFAYQQLDNAVINAADNCIGEKIFTIDTGNGCDTTANFDFIHIGTGGNATTAVEQWEGPFPITGSNSHAATSIALTNATGAGGSDTVLQITFTDVNAAINEATIKNTNVTATGDILAHQHFSTINLGASDDLTIDWTVTIDGN